MGKAIIGEKLGMSQVFTEDMLIPVTVLKAGPCVVTQVKDEEKDGYRAVQLGYGEVKPEKVNLPMKGHLAKANATPRVLAEVPLEPGEEYRPGKKITAAVFEEGDHADVTGLSRGKGFAGVVKRWGFSGGPAAHGSRFHRAPGAIGQCATPSRVFKGKKMPGRMGGVRVTALNLLVVKVDREKDLLMVKGSVPGPRGSIVIVRESVKARMGRR
ncbi:MAG: 50S ribosomal protein L3 [Actinobacteria bacterium]|nr:50S ribosomal protein L3 [Actinomycetota bacterium]MBU4301151.1 50S ribosomal protein L3 [Actinomycetota bacterium]MBU4385808.1 50S ribosomal protein L3 [Actinomycetota bacterium]MBU4490035.1 50S ribosomal protein L3 [Actinomycetota bacterium]MCG2796007.1 50S ribosomal protein L3 [Actinomycetes bacterium]